MVLVVYAHPHPGRSVAHRALLEAVRDAPGVAVSSLYDRYPDFSIDVAAEQRRLADAAAVVWQHPTYWYSVPALLKLWFDEVLARGFAYGDGGSALRGKPLLWVTTTGSEQAQYNADGRHGQPFADLTRHVEQTARYCGMAWQDPIVVHAAHRRADALAQQARQYRERLTAWTEATR
jgi:glutathione-regulated potassium-efflux system ancillary protein KefF